MAHYRGLWSRVKADGPYMCQTWFSSPWLTQTQANKLKGLCFAHFLRNLLYIHKRKGKCHWLLLPHHGMEYNKEKEFIALFLEWKISGILSASLFVHLRDRTLFNHIQCISCGFYSCSWGVNPFTPGQAGAPWGSNWLWGEWLPWEWAWDPTQASALLPGCVCARVAKLNSLTSTTMRHFCVFQSLAGDSFLRIREDFGVMQLLYGKQQKQARNTYCINSVCIDCLCSELTDSQQDELLASLVTSGKSLFLLR